MKGMDSQQMYLLFGGKSVVGRGYFFLHNLWKIATCQNMPHRWGNFSWNGETLLYLFFIVLLSELMLELQLGAGIPDLVFGGKLNVWKGIFFLLIGSLVHVTKPSKRSLRGVKFF
jgi:hypothetical protein